MKINICIKAGTCGYCDYDGCDMLIATDIEVPSIPRKNETIKLETKAFENKARIKTYDFIVTDIVYNLSALGHKPVIVVYVLLCGPYDFNTDV